MPRWHRVTPAGFVYHVLNRGTNRSRIFIDQTDYLEFCRLLVTAAARTTMRVIAYCLMPNHWHLAWISTDHHLPNRDRTKSGPCGCVSRSLCRRRGHEIPITLRVS
jgi:REP element-mobilizing transposase RayT